MPDQPTQEPVSSKATQEQKKYAASDPSVISDPNRLYRLIQISVEEAHQMDIPIASATMLGIIISAIIRRIEALESRPTGTMARKEERETFLEERETYLPGFTGRIAQVSPRGDMGAASKNSGGPVAQNTQPDRLFNNPSFSQDRLIRFTAQKLLRIALAKLGGEGPLSAVSRPVQIDSVAAIFREELLIFVHEIARCPKP